MQFRIVEQQKGNEFEEVEEALSQGLPSPGEGEAKPTAIINLMAAMNLFQVRQNFISK